MTEDNNLIIADPNNRKGDQVKLQIVPSQPKPTLSHLPNRPAVDLAFSNLTYRVKEGRKSSKYRIIQYYHFNHSDRVVLHLFIKLNRIIN